MARCDRQRLAKLTLRLRSRGAGDRNGQCVDRECPNSEEGEKNFGEHNGMECREEERITTAPGLEFGR